MRIHAIGDSVIVRPLAAETTTHIAAGGRSVVETLRDADVVLGNLEVPLTNEACPTEKTTVLRSPPEMVAEFVRLGVDAWSVATNHALDYGIAGLQETMAVLSKAGVPFAGAGSSIERAVEPVMLSTSVGERIAFFSFCSALPTGSSATARRPGIAPIRVDQRFEFDGTLIEEQPGSPPVVRSAARETDVVRAEDAIAIARDRVDRVVVALHWGVAWCFLPPNQGPLAEYQQPLARRLIDAGADLIIGHHPHALHPVEFYRDGVILYSTGNFIFHDTPVPPLEDRRFVSSTLKPILRTGPWRESAIFEIEFGDVVRPSVHIIPLVVTAGGDPILAPGFAARKILADVERMSRDLDSRVVMSADSRLSVSRDPANLP